MKKFHAITLAGVLSIGSNYASAASYTEYSSINDISTNYFTFDIGKFNTNLGTLTGVQVSVVQSTLTGSVDVTNNALVDATVNVFDTTFTAKQTNAGLGYNQTVGVIENVVTAPDWTTQTIAPENTITLNVDGVQSFSISTQNIDTGFFAAYSSAGGTGTVQFDAKSVPSITTTGGSYTVDSSLFNTTTQFAVTYTYSVIPEPTSALLGGLGVLALLRRRRR